LPELAALTPLGLAAVLYHIVSRLTYVIWVGRALQREERTGQYTKAYGEVEGFIRFRRTAALIMNNDAVSFVVMCVLTYGTWPAGTARLPFVLIGAVLVVVGLGMKLWARAAVGADRYYWRDFFGQPTAGGSAPVGGPYRFFKNPMYTVGNLHLAGLALVAASCPALAVSLFSLAAILVFNHVVERPHVRRLYGV
jgi:protein-S-isoprenylcysteine O-methyltransferase Ste14